MGIKVGFSPTFLFAAILVCAKAKPIVPNQRYFLHEAISFFLSPFAERGLGKCADGSQRCVCVYARFVAASPYAQRPLGFVGLPQSGDGTTTLLERNDTTICLQLTAVSRWRITTVTDTFGAVRYRITKTFFLPEEWQREEWYDPESEQDKLDPNKTLSEPPAWMANSIPAPRRAPQHPPYSRPLAD